MGSVYAEITLKNLEDLIMVRNGHLEEDAIRSLTLDAMVDTGAYTLVLSEEVRERLGLEMKGDDWVKLANGEPEMVKIVDAVELHWKNRKMICQPVVLPRIEKVLFGAIPLEGMDLIVDPKNEELIGRHGDRAIFRI